MANRRSQYGLPRNIRLQLAKLATKKDLEDLRRTMGDNLDQLIVGLAASLKLMQGQQKELLAAIGGEIRALPGRTKRISQRRG